MSTSVESGEMVCRQPSVLLYSYDWVIPEFVQWTNSRTNYMVGPNFVIHDKTFYIQLVYSMSYDAPAAFRFWLINFSEGPFLVDHFSFSLVGNDESELVIGSKTKTTFNEANTYNNAKADGEFHRTNLQPKFLHNRELHIRCQIQIKSTEEKKQENQIQDSSLVVDLSLQFAEQKLSFTDTILSCGGKEIPVHRFMLAARSSVFKAMFSHDETVEGQKGKVE